MSEFIEVTTGGKKWLVNIDEIVSIDKCFDGAATLWGHYEAEWPVTESYDQIKAALVDAGCTIITAEGDSLRYKITTLTQERDSLQERLTDTERECYSLRIKLAEANELLRRVSEYKSPLYYYCEHCLVDQEECTEEQCPAWTIKRNIQAHLKEADRK